jgi:hypothetical protein
MHIIKIQIEDPECIGCCFYKEDLKICSNTIRKGFYRCFSNHKNYIFIQLKKLLAKL